MQQKALDAVRNTFQKFSMIPALKAAIAHFAGDAGYATVRPPLVKLNSQQNSELLAALLGQEFSIQGL